ncbi:hypothetical protein [Halovivax limisalsi]|uniref:hypothetical protein n=1 Tax=Halovivax limisalsi TaxID=1453760 RepID=UPI001FFCC00F|nr:hypothetical protein [Halovivax limisalsi]
MAVAYGADDEEAIGNLIEQLAPREFALNKAEHVDVQDTMDGVVETEYDVHVTFFEPEERRVVRVEILQKDERWNAENLTQL